MRAFIFAIALVFSPQVNAHQAEEPTNEVRWSSINMNPGYSISTSGDLFSPGGVTVMVSSVSDMGGEYGGAIAKLDASNVRGSRIILTGILTSGSFADSPAIWMRIDGEHGKLKFATSADEPLTAGKSAERRISLLVPKEASNIVLGVVMGGNGSLQANNLVVSFAEATPSSEIDADIVLEAAIKYAKDHSINRDKIDWSETSAQLRAMIVDSEDPASAYPVLRHMISLLNDGHGTLYTPDRARRFKSEGVATTVPRVELLAGQVGYILLPGFSGTHSSSATEFADGISGKVKQLMPSVKNGWIVDLRENTGGNMWPMLCALKPLLGDGVVGSFNDGHGGSVTWRPGDNTRGCSAGGTLSDERVAVLYGSMTNSAGEAVAVAFRERPATKSFGTPTAGRSSSNSSFELPDGSLLFITTSIDVDRAGNTFGGKLSPDVLVSSAEEPDAVLSAAIAWLVGQVE